MTKLLKSKNNGFTLVEMIVVIAIIGILAAILVPSLSAYASSSKFSAVNANAKTAYNAVAKFITQSRIDENDIDLLYTASGTRPATDEMAQQLWDIIVEATGCQSPCYTVYLSNSKDVPMQVYFATDSNTSYVGGHPTRNADKKGDFADILTRIVADTPASGNLYDDTVFSIS